MTPETARNILYRRAITGMMKRRIPVGSVDELYLQMNEQLIGKKVLAVVNFPPRQIGPFVSEVLTLGVPDREGAIILVQPGSDDALIGGKLS